MRVGEVWDEMLALERRMDDTFRGFFSPYPRSRWYLPALTERIREGFVPACDVFQKNGEMIVELTLPGIDPDKDVKVTVEDGALIVRGERKQTKEIKDEDYYRKETSYGSFERFLPLPEGVKEEDVKAEYHDGLLEIHVPAPRKEIAAPKAKTIPIKTGGHTKVA